tara:strand:+ start:115 stop:462 length:348 start_codon:yes stop_codon:yes gene_type:complete
MTITAFRHTQRLCPTDGFYGLSFIIPAPAIDSLVLRDGKILSCEGATMQTDYDLLIYTMLVSVTGLDDKISKQRTARIRESVRQIGIFAAGAFVLARIPVACSSDFTTHGRALSH